MANNFCHESILHAIPIDYDNDDDDGVITEIANFLAESHLYTMEKFSKFSQQIWGNSDGDHVIDSSRVSEIDLVVMQQRCQSIFLVKWLKNYLKKDAKNKLMLEKNLFKLRHIGVKLGYLEDYG